MSNIAGPAEVDLPEPVGPVWTRTMPRGFVHKSWATGGTDVVNRRYPAFVMRRERRALNRAALEVALN